MDHENNPHFIPQTTVDDFVKNDRQWPRHLRIAHAKYQHQRALERGSEKMRKFWLAVAERNI